MSIAILIRSALEHIAAARLQADSRDRNALLDMAEQLLQDASEEFTPLQPVIHREALRKISSGEIKIGNLKYKP